MIARHPDTPPVVQTAMLTAGAASRAEAAARLTYTPRGEPAPQPPSPETSSVRPALPDARRGEPASDLSAAPPAVAEAQPQIAEASPLMLSGWLDMPEGRQVTFRIAQRERSHDGSGHRPLTAAISLHGVALGAIDVHLVVFDDQVHAVVKGDPAALDDLRAQSRLLRSQLSGSLNRVASVEVAARRPQEPRPAPPRGFVVYG